MNANVSLLIERLFFWLGAFDNPNNPNGIPNTLPIKITLDEVLGLFSQEESPELKAALQKTYAFGSTVGNAMDDSDLGRKYCDDFHSFINKSTMPCSRILEIGAGRGFLASQLIQAGHTVTALEPGMVNVKHWEKYGVSIIQDYFPSSKAQGKFDVIIFYGVLEHVNDYKGFLKNVVKQLESKGSVLIAVPDCSLEIEHGDPSMLLHEHYHYFTPSSLRRTLQSVGLDADIQPSGYGRSIYACAKASDLKEINKPADEELAILKAYPDKVRQLADNVRKHLANTLEKGTLGIYCPARALAFLPHDAPVRFFDDSPDLHGKYYPPFQSRIESRDELLKDPTDTLWIMSRTFGARLARDLRPQLRSTNILTVQDLIG